MTCFNTITGNDWGFYLAEQDQCGTPNATPEFVPKKRISGKAERTKKFVKSAAINTSKQPLDNIADGSDLGDYTLATEMNKSELNLMTASIRGDSLPEFMIFDSNTISIDPLDNSINDSALGLTDLTAGRWVWVNGETAYQVFEQVDSGKVIIHPAQPVIEILEGVETSLYSNTIRSAKTDRYFTAQNRVKDLSAAADNTAFQTQVDALIKTMNITVPAEGIVTASFTMMAQDAIDGTSKLQGQTDAVLTKEDTESIGTVDGTETVWIDFAKTNAGVTTMSLDTDLAVTSIKQQGAEYISAQNTGTMVAGGSINLISVQEDPLKEVRKYNGAKRFAIAIMFKYPDGSRLILTMRKVIYTALTQNDEADAIVESSGTYDVETDEFGSAIQYDYMFLSEGD